MHEAPEPQVVRVNPAAGRIDLLDGLRGIAIILVVLSHGWTIWPTERISEQRWSWDLFGSGNYAVSIFFVIGGYLATAALLRRADSPRDLHPAIELVRRWIRLSGQVYALMLVVVLVSVFDTSEDYDQAQTSTSVLRVLTYTWNWFARAEPLYARPDIGHLWYVSVDMQVFILVLFVVFLLRRRRAWLVVALAVILLSALTWRSHVYQTEGLYEALLRSTVRMDAPVTGALVAAALPYLERLRRFAPALITVGVVALVPLLHFTRPDAGYFEWPGVTLDLALAAVVVGTALGRAPSLVERPLSWGPLTLLGRHSLALYLWHYPVFWFVSRHAVEWHWWWRTVLALAITAVATVLSDRLVERPVQRLLRAPVWRDLEADAPAVLREGLRQAVRR